MIDTQPAPGAFPRLFFTIADLPALRAKLEHPDCRPAWARLLAACEQMLSPDPPPICPRHIRAPHLAFAYLMTGREAFAAKAREMARAFLEPEPWGKGVGLATGGALATTGLVYDWLHDVLSADERAALRRVMWEYGLAPHLESIRRGDPATAWYTCNGMCVINGPALMASLLLDQEIDTRDVCEASLRQLRRAIDAHDPDGGYPEGLGYWNYGVRHLLLGIEPLRRLRGIDLYHEPFLHATGDYALHNIHPWLTQCANIADSTRHTRLWPPVAAFAAYHRRPEWQWLAQRLLRHDWGEDGEALEYSLFYLLFYDPDLPTAPPAEEGRDKLFSGLQQLSWRSDWREDAIHVVWLNGPANVHHNHLHLNSFTLSAFGERLLIEMGQYNYADDRDHRKQTAGHNSLLVDGEGQIITTDPADFCRRLRPGQWSTVFGEFRNLREEAGAIIGTGSVVNAYAGRLRAFDRTLAFIDRRILFLHDHIALEQAPPAELTWLFHAAGDITCDGEDWHFVTGNARLLLRPLAAQALSAAVNHDHSERGYSTIRQAPDEPRAYLSLHHRCAVTTCDLYLLLVPYRAGETPDVVIERCPVPHRPVAYASGDGFCPQETVPVEIDGVAISFAGRRWRYDPLGRSLRPEAAPA